MGDATHYLVVDGYAEKDRLNLVSAGCSAARDIYANMLRQYTPGAVTVDVVAPADGDPQLPVGMSLADYDGIGWTGSNLTIHADDPRVHRQINFAKAGFAAGVPMFGSCWAAQIAVSAAGGVCGRNPRGREMGVGRKITLNGDGRGHPMFRGKKSVFDSFMFHEDEVTHMPADSMILAHNGFTHIQAVAVNYLGGAFWAVQYHPEFNLHEVARLVQCRAEIFIRDGFFADRDAVNRYADKLDILNQNPDRTDIAWELGIDDDILNEDLRQREVKNWIDQAVLPRKI